MFIKKEELKSIRIKLSEMEVEQKILKNTIYFLCKHNRDEIVVEPREFENLKLLGFFGSSKEKYIKYIDNDGMYQEQSTLLHYTMEIENIEKVDNNIYVLQFKDTREDDNLKGKNKFLQLNKETNEILDITDIKARYENQEKVSAHLKESAQALSEVVKDFFKAKDTHQKLNEKTTTAKKTKKTTRGKQNDKQVQGK